MAPPVSTLKIVGLTPPASQPSSMPGAGILQDPSRVRVGLAGLVVTVELPSGYKLNAVTSLVQSFRMFNNMSDSGQYRMNFDLGANTRLFKWLTWNLGFSDRYLSNPVPGRKSNDILYTTGIGISFAR